LGSTFWFTFEAIATDKEAVEQGEIDDTNLESFTDFSPRVLLVDDNQVNRQVAGEMLKAAGCTVDLANDGHQAIEKASSKPYDIIFMDIQMPVMDGVTATKQLKSMSLPSLAPIVAMTAYGMEPDKERFLSQGLDDYLAKPIKANNLVNKVKKWVSGTTDMVEDRSVKNNQHKIIDELIIAQLAKYSGPEMVKEILKDFELETQGQLQQCSIALKEEDFQSILRDLHTLKGSAGTLGVEKLAQKAKEIEQDLKSGQYDSTPKNLSELNILFKEFQNNYHNILNL
jgi:CheY-like chemotaxis protein